MTLRELPIGRRFKANGRRRILTKRADTSTLLLKEEFPGSALYIQHDEKGDPIFIPMVEVMNSSGRKWNMPPETEVISVP